MDSILVSDEDNNANFYSKTSVKTIDMDGI